MNEEHQHEWLEWEPWKPNPYYMVRFCRHLVHAKCGGVETRCVLDD